MTSIFFNPDCLSGLNAIQNGRIGRRTLTTPAAFFLFYARPNTIPQRYFAPGARVTA